MHMDVLASKAIDAIYKNWQSIPSKYFQNYGFAKFNRRIYAKIYEYSRHLP